MGGRGDESCFEQAGNAQETTRKVRLEIDSAGELEKDT